jgi:hypothetical protein
LASLSQFHSVKLKAAELPTVILLPVSRLLKIIFSNLRRGRFFAKKKKLDVESVRNASYKTIKKKKLEGSQHPSQM